MLRVCCAIIQHEDKVLVAQRNEKGLLPMKWEFPGGKVEQGETDEECIVREIKEELDMIVTIEKRLSTVVHHYDTFSLTLIPFVCNSKTANYTRQEHNQVVWSTVKQLSDYDWAEADIPVYEEFLLDVNQ
ncbi:(deoxy)nucleoside triphosphate pyrophosphohydrolase [Myroides injenensis]|uniref:(deoxy)nucleoside triphosphate pyrophosphohydrolase n=1 Tax=Myroides injenensis TaxID=1183151 RepID=UPI00028839BF|nr:(deoxy)nucleoside triphosphate pyrophosphohydrolase [Myroides injenensis]